MPTIFTHAAVPLMLGDALGRRRIPRPPMVAGAVAAMLPDADVLGFRLGLPYVHDLGHRGATHSIVLALACALLAMALQRSLRVPPRPALGFVFLQGALTFCSMPSPTAAWVWRSTGLSNIGGSSSTGVPSRFRPSVRAFSSCAAGT